MQVACPILSYVAPVTGRQKKNTPLNVLFFPLLFAELTPVALLSVYAAQVSMETGGGLSPGLRQLQRGVASRRSLH